MSLIKTDLNRKIKESWYKNKSTKRLITLRKKCINNYTDLEKVEAILRKFSMFEQADEVYKLWYIWVYKSAQLDRIIQTRC